MKLNVKTVVLSALCTNCYVVGDDDEVIIIDTPSTDGLPQINSLVDGRNVSAIVCTHGHYDHIAGSDVVRKRYKAPLLIHKDDEDALTDGDKSLSSQFGLISNFGPASNTLTDGDEIKAGKFSFKVIHTPGHTPGSICLYTDGHLFCGDTIFNFGVGRTDFQGGDSDKLRNSIKNKIFTLPDETIIYPGHEYAPGVTLLARKRYGVGV